MAVSQRQRLYSGVRMFAGNYGNYLSFTPRALRIGGAELERRSVRERGGAAALDGDGDQGRDGDGDRGRGRGPGTEGLRGRLIRWGKRAAESFSSIGQCIITTDYYIGQSVLRDLRSSKIT